MASERSAKRHGTGHGETKEPKAPEEVTLELIAQKLDRLTWRHQLWGVDEREVWHVVQRLDQMYRQLYREQQVRYEALLAQARQEAAKGDGSSPESQATSVLPTLQDPMNG